MRAVNTFIFISMFLYIQTSFSQDYFNPLFLGDDVASLDDLSYLNMGSSLSPGSYYLYLYIGDRFTGNINIIFKENHDKNNVDACFTKEILDKIPLNNNIKNKLNTIVKSNQECINMYEYIDNFDYDVDLTKLIIRLSIPQIYLLDINPSLANEEDWNDGIPAFLMNYNFNGSHSRNNKGYDYSSYYLNLNNRVNLGAWRFKSNSYINKNKLGSKSSYDINTNNINLSRNINRIKSTLTVGHGIIGSSLFDSNSYIGATLETANDLLPDSDKGYSPSIRGIAETKSKLTIKQNNNIVYQKYINQGPYEINNLNSVGSSGDYVVELTSSNGVVTKYTVPYSSLPNLLRTGKYSYSLTLGRANNNSNDNKFIQSIFSIGLPYESTFFSGQQFSKRYLSLGLGISKDFGNFGALSINSVYAESKINNEKLNGESYRILYAKSFNDIGTNIQLTGYKYSTSSFYSFNEAIYKDSNNNVNDYIGRKKDSFQVNLSQSLNDYGQFYIWGNISSYWGSNMKTKNIQLGWNKTIKKLNNIMLTISYNKTVNNVIHDDLLFMSLSIPISNDYKDNYMYLSNSTAIDKSSYNNSTNIYGDFLDRNLNYSIYQIINKENNSNTSNINVSYKANTMNINVGSIYSAQSKQIDYGLSGGILVHEGGVSFVREATDTAILIEAKGANGAKINRSGENIIIDRNGYALIPYATPYHYNDVELDPSTFGNGYDVNEKIKKIAPTRGAISKVTFDVRKGFNYLVSVYYKGNPIKFGTLVSNNQDKFISIANDDGMVYLSGVKNDSIYTVKLSNNSSCSFSIHYDNKVMMKTVNKLNVNCL